MTLLLRTIFRHQSNRLSSLLRKQFRPIDVCRINLHDERHHKKHDFPNIHIPTDVQPIEKRIHKKTKMYIYLGVIVVGVVAIGVSIVAIFRQFRSLYNPDIIHAAALARCINDPRVQDALGVPIKECEKQPFRHDIVYDRGGHPFMRIEFSIEGVQGKATVQLEKRLVCSTISSIRFTRQQFYQ